MRDLVSAQTEAVRVVVSGPGAELDQVRGHLEAAGGNLAIHYAVLDTEAALLGAGLPALCRDTHVTILPVFTVPNRQLIIFSLHIKISTCPHTCRCPGARWRSSAAPWTSSTPPPVLARGRPAASTTGHTVTLLPEQIEISELKLQTDLDIQLKVIYWRSGDCAGAKVCSERRHCLLPGGLQGRRHCAAPLRRRPGRCLDSGYLRSIYYLSDRAGGDGRGAGRGGRGGGGAAPGGAVPPAGGAEAGAGAGGELWELDTRAAWQ